MLVPKDLFVGARAHLAGIVLISPLCSRHHVVCVLLLQSSSPCCSPSRTALPHACLHARSTVGAPAPRHAARARHVRITVTTRAPPMDRSDRIGYPRSRRRRGRPTPSPTGARAGCMPACVQAIYSGPLVTATAPHRLHCRRCSLRAARCVLCSLLDGNRTAAPRALPSPIRRQSSLIATATAAVPSYIRRPSFMPSLHQIGSFGKR